VSVSLCDKKFLCVRVCELFVFWMLFLWKALIWVLFDLILGWFLGTFHVSYGWFLGYF